MADFHISSIQIIHYSNARFLLLIGQINSEQIVWYSDHHLNNKLFDYWITSDHYNTRLVRYSDPQFSQQCNP